MKVLEITPSIEKIEIITDSLYTINCVTKWYKTWMKNNWKTANKKEVKNKDLIQKILKLIKTKDEIKWTHVAGHKGIYGNEQADKLASEAITFYKSPLK